MTGTPDIENVKRLIAAEYPLVEGLRCIRVYVPDDDSYVWALNGFMSLLGRNWAFVGTPEERQSRASLWENALKETDWSGCVDCDEVKDCIETDTGVRDAINDIYNPQSPDKPLPAELQEENLITGVTDCDPDELFAGCQGLVNGLNRQNIDAFEITEVVSNIAERAALIFSAIPILETLPINELVTYVEQIWTDELFETYLANDTEGYRNELACDLFCIALDAGCHIDIHDVFDYFVLRIGANPLENLANLTEYIVLGTWTGTEVNDIFYAMQLIYTYYGNKYFSNVGIPPLQIYINEGTRTPNPDWNIICDDCPAEWTYTATLTELELWTDYSAGDEGIWSAGNGWTSNPLSTFRGMAIFGIATTAPFECLKVRVKITASMTGDSQLLLAGQLSLDGQVSGNMGSSLDFEVTVNQTIDGLAVGFYPDDNIPGDPANFPGYCYEVVVTGFGYQPPELGG